MSRLIGLHDRVSTSSEILLGRDVFPQVGQRVSISARYANDVWARDESGGRHGSVVKLVERESTSREENKAQVATSCLVQWDTANGKSWSEGVGSRVSACYTGLYRCGANGHYQLALDPRSQPADSEIEVRKRRARTKGTQSESEETSATQAKFDASELFQLHQDVSDTLNQVRVRVKADMERAMDACDDWIDEAELALALDGSDMPVDDRTPAASEGDKGRKGKGVELSEEEKLLGKEIEDIWKVLNRAEVAFRKKVEADEIATRTLKELQEFLFPMFLTFCVAEIPELARGLERISESGTQDLKGASDYGKFTRRTVTAYKTPAALLVYDPDADPEEQAANLQEFRNGLKEVAAEMQTWKLRTGLPPGEESKPLFVIDPKNPEQNPAKRPLFIDTFMSADGGAPVEELAGKLEELAQRPEAVLVKEDLDKIVDTMRTAAAAFEDLAKWSQEASDPKNQTAEQAKTLKAERDTAIEKIMEAFGKGQLEAADKEGEKKGEEKEKEKEEEEAQRRGPEYDLEDSLGAVLMGTQLEEEQRKVRETVQRISIRVREVQRQREIAAELQAPLTADAAIETEETADDMVRRHLGGKYRGMPGRGGGASTGGGVMPGMRETSMYGGLLRMHQVEPAEGGADILPHGDLVRARTAVNEAGRQLRRCDVRRVKEAMEALGEADGGSSEWFGERVGALEARMAALDGRLTHLEDATLQKARNAVTRAELLLLGPARGEVLGDAGGAAAALDAARNAFETAATSVQLRETEGLTREKQDAIQQHQASVDTVRRLLHEGAALLTDAEKMLEEATPLDALLAFKSAEEKCARAAIAADKSQPNLK